MSNLRLVWFVAAFVLGSVGIVSAQSTGVPGSQLPLASPAPSDVLFGIHGGTSGVGGTTSKFPVFQIPISASQIVPTSQTNATFAGAYPFIFPFAIGVNGSTPASIQEGPGSPMYPTGYLYDGNQGIWLGAKQPADGIYVGTYNPAVPNDSVGHHRVFWAEPAFGVPMGGGSVFIGTNAGGNGDSSTGGGNYAMGGGAMQSLNGGSYNEGIGAHCLSGLTTGYQNVCMGVNAAATITDGAYNVVLGGSALVTGDPSNSVFIGEGSGGSATASPNYDVFVGRNTAQGISGNEDVAVGDLAGQNLTTATQDTILGASAGQGLTTNGNNVVVGYNAGNGGNFTQSVFIGQGAGLYAGSAGTQNTVVGTVAGANVTASYNSFFGYGAGNAATSTYFSTYLGTGAGFSGTGNENTCDGVNCLTSASGALNSASGYDAGYSVTSGFDNSLFGSQAGYGITTGNLNSILGIDVDTYAVTAITTGSSNIEIGANVAVPSPTASGQLSIANAIFGLNNLGTDATVSTGCIGLYTKTCAYPLDVNGTARFNSTIVNGPLYINTSSTSGPSITNGSGAPTGACVSGSFYTRTDTGAAAGSTTYDCRGSAWYALSGG